MVKTRWGTKSNLKDGWTRAKGEDGSGETAGGTTAENLVERKNLMGDLDNAGEEEMKLPERVLSGTNMPKKSRLNIYSTPEHLGVIADLMEKTEEWDKLMGSQFGSLFKLHVSRCAHSSKLIHGLLARQLVTTKKNEMWCVYAGKPLRFSLREFGLVTGLKCGAYPTEEKIIENRSKGQSVWSRLFKRKPPLKVVDVIDLLKENENLESAKQMKPWAKLAMALIVIVDGVVVCNNKHNRITSEFVEMLENVDFFLEYPWGRLAFTETLGRFGMPDTNNPVEDLKIRLFQRTSACYGFPLALQLLAFKCIPQLLSKVPNKSDERNFVERRYVQLSTVRMITEDEINNVEIGDEVTVDYTLMNMEEGNDTMWEDEVEDPKVNLILKLLGEGHEFKPTDWPVHNSGTVGKVELDTEGEGEGVEDVTEKVELKKEGSNVRKPLTRAERKVREDEENKKPEPKRRRNVDMAIRYKEEEGGKEKGRGLDELEKFIVNENIKLRRDIVADVMKLLKGNGSSQGEIPKTTETPASRLRQCRKSRQMGDREQPERMSKRKKTKTGTTEEVVGERNVNEEGGGDGNFNYDNPAKEDGIEPLSERWNLYRGVQEVVTGINIEEDGSPSQIRGWEGIDDELIGTKGEGQVSSENNPDDDGNNEKAMDEEKIDPMTAMVVASSAYYPMDGDLGKRIPIRSHYLDSNRFASDVRLKTLFASRSKKPTYSPYPNLDEGEFETFKGVMDEAKDQSYTIVTKHTLSTQDFMDIAEQGRGFTTENMKVVVAMLWRKRGATYLEERKAFFDPWFLTLLESKYDDFKTCKDKRKFCWGLDLKLYVSGKKTGKLLKTEFGKNVDVVYVPMEWPNNKWVGIVINLKENTITILDPLPKQRGKSYYERLVTPIAQSLPWLLRQYGCGDGREEEVKKFEWRRVDGIYTNNNVGDSGPIAAKFMEMHAFYNSVDEMDTLSDASVEKIRKSYAIDIYDEFVKSSPPV